MIRLITPCRQGHGQRDLHPIGEFAYVPGSGFHPDLNSGLQPFTAKRIPHPLEGDIPDFDLRHRGWVTLPPDKRRTRNPK
ncbi:MAG: hypothetical protein SynsKO_12020 [Synoicihabitans sp.]